MNGDDDDDLLTLEGDNDGEVATAERLPVEFPLRAFVILREGLGGVHEDVEDIFAGDALDGHLLDEHVIAELDPPRGDGIGDEAAGGAGVHAPSYRR